ncbi:ABC transporter substrate-binding protein [Pseudomonas typographi]|uniref:ABC transporter substrate-binding protein n=1 Tax=Pseudomonas typographi TaxID=2715964 RepID=A0ABR7Z2N0_9PSED|nr:ABC transporter substrate-binding protein [Pseudomonas typographi]MBD1585884.1 ABC transporter substrate-binding protein [Pseudomonas typographi]MBD1599750.1 ABC transporter substrate-binding protein [Pseudomonas typographi]
MNARRLPRLLAGVLLIAGSVGVSVTGWAQPPRQKLIIAMYESATPKLAKASGVFDGTPYDLEWVILPGAAQQISALYANAIDLGCIGDTGLVFEAANSAKDWSVKGGQLVNFAAWQWGYASSDPIMVTAVRTDKGINSPRDLAGKTWAYNFGGTSFALYNASLIKAGLKPADIKPAQMVDAYAGSVAFARGDVDVVSGDYYSIKSQVESGKAKVMWTAEDAGVPDLGVLAAKPQVLQEKHQAIADLLVRIGRYNVWYHQNPEQAQSIIASALKLSPERAAYFWSTNRWNYIPISERFLAEQQNNADLFYGAGALKKKVDVRSLWTTEFDASTAVQP